MEPKASFLDKILPKKTESQPEILDRAGVLDSCVRQVIRPIRIFQFLMVILILTIITYTINYGAHNVSSIACILILAVSGVYVFVLALDLICQFSGGEIPVLPMFIFSLLGTLFFACAGIMLLFMYTSPWAIVTIACLSLVTFILFIIDVTLILAFWRRNCSICRKCCYAKTTELLYQATGECDPACTETVKYDLMTSVSSVHVSSGDEETTPDHSMRKVSFGRRRQYVDTTTSARTLAKTGARDVQTEKRPVIDVQSQTPREVKEMPVQTISRCEMCNRKINLSSKSSGTLPPAVHPCSPCPALVQLFRGAPCTPGCRCNVTGIIQVSQQNQQAQTQHQQQQQTQAQTQQREVRSESVNKDKTSRTDQNARDMLPSELKNPKIAGISITKVMLASCAVPPKKSNTSSQTDDEEKATEVPCIPKNTKKRKELRRKHELLIPEKEATNDRRLHSNRNSKSMKFLKTQSELGKEEAKNNLGKKSVVPRSAPTQGGNHGNPGNPGNPGNSKKENKNENKEDKKTENTNENKNDDKNDNESLKTESALVSGDDSDAVISLSGSSFSGMRLGRLESKRIIHPTKQVAEMMDRLLEIEEARGDSSMISQIRSRDYLTASPSERRINLYDEQPPTSTTESPERLKNTRNVVGVQPIEKRRISFAENTRTGHTDSEADEEDSEVSIVEATEKDVAMLKENHEVIVEEPPEVPKLDLPREPETLPGMDSQPTSSRVKRTYGFRRKNKIEPSDASYDMDIQRPDASEAGYVEKLEEEKLLAEERDTFDEKGANTCPVCKKLQLPAPSSYQYCNVYRDKRGRIYCENCATPNTIKVHYKREYDQKRLKCTVCANVLRIRTHHSARDRPGNCPHCGQMQVSMPTESPVSV